MLFRSFLKNVVKVGDVVTIVCPASDAKYDGTGYRSGFADVKTLSINGVSRNLSLGNAVSQTTFTVTASGTANDAVKDRISFIVPAGATYQIAGPAVSIWAELR